MTNMMTSLDECPFKPGMGTINASGVIKNINGAKISVTETFLREAVQNSYDAVEKEKIEKDGKLVLRRKPLIFKMRAFHYENQQLQNIKQILGGSDHSSFFSKNVAKNISKSDLNIEVTDLNTSGLTGTPEPTEKIGSQNFANFVYFTGNDKQKDKTSGGSYGFGKAALYAYSKARTIAIYTKIKNSDGHSFSSRFIVVCVDERIIESNSDRCWWGKRTYYQDKSRGIYAAPILGEEADKYAEVFGFEPFEQDQTGTKLMILSASPDELPEDTFHNIKTIEQIFKEDLPRYIVHWYWNKITAKSIEFHLEYEDVEVEIDDPHQVFPYNKFIQAYKTYLEAKKENKLILKTATFIAVKHERPKVTLGYASLCNTFSAVIPYSDLFEVFSTSEPVVAFMRGIGHIVYYEKFPRNTNNLEQTCYGIFKVSEKSAPDGEKEGYIDEYFRAIENQTHDRWEHQKEKYRYNFLKTVTSTIKELVDSNTVANENEEKSSDISILIQRTLGAKLMPYIASVGGASLPQSEQSIQEERSSERKSLIRPTGRTEIQITGGNKIIGVEYKVSARNEKSVVIKKITPFIKTEDNEKIENSSLISFYSVELLPVRGPKNQSKIMFMKLPNEKLSSELSSSTRTILINIACKNDCAFDLDIEWEEK